MNIGKYKLPNFFIKKIDKNNKPGYNYSGAVFYVDKIDSNSIEAKFFAKINIPGYSEYTTVHKSRGVYDIETFEKEFYHVARLNEWKKHYLVHAIFSAEAEEAINDI